MIRSTLKQAARLLTLPVTLPLWAVGNAFMVPLLKGQLRREAARSKRAEESRDIAQMALRQIGDGILCLDRFPTWPDVRKILDDWRGICDALTIERDAARTNLARLREEFDALDAAHNGAVAEYQDLSRRYTALRSAVEDEAQRGDEFKYVNGPEMAKRLRAALAADKPLPAAPTEACCMERCTELGMECRWKHEVARPPIEGDHPADLRERLVRVLRSTGGDDYGEQADAVLGVIGVRSGDYPADEKIQGWAAAIEHVTKERDRYRVMVDADASRLEAASKEIVGLRLKVETLTRELADADRDHDAALAEVKIRHRDVLLLREDELAAALDLCGKWAWPALIGEVRALRQLGRKS